LCSKSPQALVPTLAKWVQGAPHWVLAWHFSLTLVSLDEEVFNFLGEGVVGVGGEVGDGIGCDWI